MPGGADARAPRELRALVLGVFALAILGSTLVDNLWPAPIPKPIGREKVVDDARRAAARWTDGSRMVLIDDDLKLASRVRAFVRPKYVTALYEVFDEASGSDVIRGDDGWMFLASRTGAALTDPLDLTLERSGLLFAALHRRMANLGIRLISVPLPRKEVVEREHLPKWVRVEEGLDFSLVETWRSRGVETVDLLPLFENPPGDPIYFKHGTHWTHEARLLAAEEIARQAGLWAPPDERSTTLRAGPTMRRDHDMLTRLGFDLQGARARAGFEARPIMMLAKENGVVLRCRNELPMPALAMGGTSFTNDSGIVCHLRHFADQPVWSLAVPGGDGASALSRYLTEHAERAQILVLETPNHVMLDRAYTHSVCATLAEHPPATALTALSLPLRIDEEFKRNAGQIPPGPGVRLTHLAPTLLGTSGDGVVELHLGGAVSGGDIDIVVSIKEFQRFYRWRANHSAPLVVPLLAYGNSVGAVQVRARAVSASAGVDLQQVQLVIAGDTHVVDLAPRVGERASERSNGRWVRTLLPARAATLPRHGALWIQLGGGVQPVREVEVTVRAADGAHATWPFELLDSAAPIVVNIGALHGRVLERVEVRASSPLPAISSARVLAP